MEEQIETNAVEADEEQDWASGGGCGPAIDSASAWTRMGDTCCGDDVDEQDAEPKRVRGGGRDLQEVKVPVTGTSCEWKVAGSGT